MKKVSVNRFIQKYNLSGLIESTKWNVKGDTLTTQFISDDKSVLGNVSMTDFQFEDGDYGIYDTTKLTKMLSVLSNDVDITPSKYEGKVTALDLNDKEHLQLICCRPFSYTCSSRFKTTTTI